MTDFSTETEISRDKMVEMLAEDDNGQTAYVLAELAGQMERGTMAYDDLCDNLTGLEPEQRESLRTFAAALVETLADD